MIEKLIPLWIELIEDWDKWQNENYFNYIESILKYYTGLSPQNIPLKEKPKWWKKKYKEGILIYDNNRKNLKK